MGYLEPLGVIFRLFLPSLLNSIGIPLHKMVPHDIRPGSHIDV